MWLGDLNKIKQHWYWSSFMLEVNCKCHICFVVGRCPHISGKVQFPLIFLSPVSQTIFFSYKSHLILPVASLWCVCVPEQRLVWHHKQLSASKVCDIQVVQSSLEFETHDHSWFGRVTCFQWPSTQSQLCHFKSGLVLGSVEEKCALSLCHHVLVMTVRHLPLATCSKASVIDPSFLFFSASQAASTYQVWSAAATISSPQHTFACLWRLPVDLASPVSR